jgi:hypothetical protein
MIQIWITALCGGKINALSETENLKATPKTSNHIWLMTGLLRKHT